SSPCCSFYVSLVALCRGKGRSAQAWSAVTPIGSRHRLNWPCNQHPLQLCPLLCLAEGFSHGHSLSPQENLSWIGSKDGPGLRSHAEGFSYFFGECDSHLVDLPLDLTSERLTPLT